MRANVLAGLALVAAGGLLVLFAPAAPEEAPIALASVDATPAPPGAGGPSPSLAVMAAGAAGGLVGLVLLAHALRPRDLE